MIRRKRSPLRYLIPALIVGGALFVARTWFGGSDDAPPAGSITSVSEEVQEAYDGLGRDFRAKVPVGEFTAMFHRMADPEAKDKLPEVREARVFEGAGPEPPRARFRVEYPGGEAKAEYYFARVDGQWQLQSFARVSGDWRVRPSEPSTASPSSPSGPPSPAPRPAPPAPKPGASPPTPPPAAAKAKDQPPCHYVIQPGDTLSTVSRRFYGTSRHWRRILEANPGLQERRLRIGRKIFIPALPGQAAPATATP